MAGTGREPEALLKGASLLRYGGGMGKQVHTAKDWTKALGMWVFFVVVIVLPTLYGLWGVFEHVILRAIREGF